MNIRVFCMILVYMSKKRNQYTCPFTYPIDNNINIHIEHMDGNTSCIWFDNNNQEEQNIPNELKIYNSKDQLVIPFRNTQSYAISRDASYTIKYRDNTVILLTTEILLCSPPIRMNEIKIVASDDEDSDSGF